MDAEKEKGKNGKENPTDISVNLTIYQKKKQQE